MFSDRFLATLLRNRAPEMVSACLRLIPCRDPTARYWSLALLNQLSSEPPVIEEILHQGLHAKLGDLIQPSSDRNMIPDTGSPSRLAHADDVKHQAGSALLAERADMQAMAWAVHQSLDGSLARVQAAWLAAHLAAAGLEEAEALVTCGGGEVVSGLVRPVG